MVAVKARREGSHSTNVKLCKASGGGGGYDARETWGDTMGIRRSEGSVREVSMS